MPKKIWLHVDDGARQSIAHVAAREGMHAEGRAMRLKTHTGGMPKPPLTPRRRNRRRVA